MEQLARVNETIMRQLQELMARKHDAPREAARRAALPAGAGGGTPGSSAAAGFDKGGHKAAERAKELEEKNRPVAVQADMQRLIAEVGKRGRGGGGGGEGRATAVGNSINSVLKNIYDCIFPREIRCSIDRRRNMRLLRHVMSYNTKYVKMIVR